MGAKKRQARKKGAGEEDEDISTELFIPLYRKKCKELTITSLPPIVNLFNDALESGEEVKNVLSYVDIPKR